MKYYICPNCGEPISYKQIQAARQKRCLCGEEIESRVLKTTGVTDGKLHYRCAWCMTDNVIDPERVPSSYTVTCKCCHREIARVYQYAPIVYGGRDYAKTSLS